MPHADARVASAVMCLMLLQQLQLQHRICGSGSSSFDPRNADMAPPAQSGDWAAEHDVAMTVHMGKAAGA